MTMPTKLAREPEAPPIGEGIIKIYLIGDYRLQGRNLQADWYQAKLFSKSLTSTEPLSLTLALNCLIPRYTS